jgi:hypothetical protein
MTARGSVDGAIKPVNKKNSGPKIKIYHKAYTHLNNEKINVVIRQINQFITAAFRLKSSES